VLGLLSRRAIDLHLAQRHTHPNTHTSKHTDTQTHRHPNTHTSKHSHIQTHRHPTTQTSKDTDIQTTDMQTHRHSNHRHPNTQTFKHTDIQRHRHSKRQTCKETDISRVMAIWQLSCTPRPPFSVKHTNTHIHDESEDPLPSVVH